MANQGNTTLKSAYDAGYAAFYGCEQTSNGFFIAKSNPFSKNTLMNKTWEQGYNKAYFDNGGKCA